MCGAVFGTRSTKISLGTNLEEKGISPQFQVSVWLRYNLSF